jgi:hypothetical protein
MNNAPGQLSGQIFYDAKLSAATITTTCCCCDEICQTWLPTPAVADTNNKQKNNY